MQQKKIKIYRTVLLQQKKNFPNILQKYSNDHKYYFMDIYLLLF